MNWQMKHPVLSIVILGVFVFIPTPTETILLVLGALGGLWLFLWMVAMVRLVTSPITAALNWSFLNQPATRGRARSLLPDADPEQTDAAIAESLALLDELEADHATPDQH
jgi:hypothetical protein